MVPLIPAEITESASEIVVYFATATGRRDQLPAQPGHRTCAT